MAFSAIVGLTAYFFVLESKLAWRSPAQLAATTESGDALVINGVRWQRWSPDLVARLQAEGKPVLVNFTAEWCLTCHTVVEPAIEHAETQAKINKLGAVLVYADYTNTPEELTRELQKFGRAGVPLVLVYAGEEGAKPEVIPDSIVSSVFRGNLRKALARLDPS
jgi:thiol:disulfide interchange protein DsbD